MDLISVVGFLIAWILIIGDMASGENLGAYVNIPSVLITLGGTIRAVIASFPGDKFKSPELVEDGVNGFVVGDTCSTRIAICWKRHAGQIRNH